MNIEVLISTMNLINQKDLIKKSNTKSSVIINQTENITLEDITEGKHRLYSYQEKGLSRSRNKAIKNSRADICAISDDDIRYEDNYEEIIKEGYRKYPDADVIAFYLDNVDKNINRPRRKEGKINFLKSMQIKSSQITFKRKSIVDKNIKFKERFGAGSELYMGEENIFLVDCLKAGLKIYYIPITIATTQENNSSWFRGYNEYNFNVRGAAYYEMSKNLYPLLILQFAIRKTNLYADVVKPLNAIKYMFKGANQYRKSLKKKIYFMGDFCSNTGPAIVNKNYYPYMQEDAYICKTNSKIIRPLHFIFNIFRSDVLLISCLSKFHIKAAKLTKKLNKKVVYLMHGYNKVEYHLNEVPEDKRILRDVEEEMLSISDKIICVSEKLCEYMKNERKDIANKFDFVNNGIEILEKPIKKREDNEKAYTIISTGGGKKNKNNLTVCKAISKIKDFEIKYIVIGELSTEGEEIKKYNFVEYYENLSHEEVLNKMYEADLYIQNSYFETFGLAIIEAIETGCKILITKNIGALSIIDNIEENMLINKNEDVEEICNKIKKMINCRKNYKYIKDIQQYTWEAESKRLKNKLLESEE